jgi:UDP-2,3-diacylglucosamine pyrophosphatase LpxH
MISDFTIITKHFPDNKDIVLIPISDVHLGTAEHMEAAWREFRTAVQNEENTYIVLLGDLVNNAIRNSVSNVYDEVLRPREQKRLMVEMLEPLRDKILCAVPGNHEARSSKEVDDDVMYDIMAKLDLEDLYRENIAFLKIQIGNLTSNGTRNPTYTFAITHGSGGGILTGGAVNRAERFGYAIDGADALIVGHTHKPFNTYPGKIKIDANNNRVSVKPFHVVNCSSWLDFAGYAMKHMMLPTAHVAQKILLSGKSKDMKIVVG